MIKNAVFVPGEVPSLKNSKIKTANGVFPSKAVSNYLHSLGIQRYGKDGVKGYKLRPNLFEARIARLRCDLFGCCKPIRLGFYFVRGTKRRFDLINAAQIVCDLLVAHGVIEDDDSKNLIPVFVPDETGFAHCVDKNNPGVWIGLAE